jgi:hypothetical protein
MSGAHDAISIIGGPQRSIQVNSSNTPRAVNLSTVDLSLAGPKGTGGDFAVFGGPATAPGGVNFGSTGSWVYPATPISDPYAQINAPAQPTTAGLKSPAKAASKCSVPGRGCYRVNGCPDSGGCDEYTGGYYPTRIQVKNGTAIFDPGVYYVVGGMTLDANSNVRVSTDPGDGSGGFCFICRAAAHFPSQLIPATARPTLTTLTAVHPRMVFHHVHCDVQVVLRIHPACQRRLMETFS